jgi:Mn-dependent transcriptional regulator
VRIQESAEDYLETILILKHKRGVVRSIDIANELGFSKPSISVAMKHFRENGLITMDSDGEINLTEEGQKRAEHVYERHQLLTRYLISIGVDSETAEKDACKIEHVISDKSFECLKALTTEPEK